MKTKLLLLILGFIVLLSACGKTDAENIAKFKKTMIVFRYQKSNICFRFASGEHKKAALSYLPCNEIPHFTDQSDITLDNRASFSGSIRINKSLIFFEENEPEQQTRCYALSPQEYAMAEVPCDLAHPFILSQKEKTPHPESKKKGFYPKGTSSLDEWLVPQ